MCNFQKVLLSLSRILLEFVDNALDDAEVLFHESGGRYPYPIQITIAYDKNKKVLTITDNCRGMSLEQLEHLVVQVGESTKKGVSWLNGQFGFGLHSFRAAAKHCTVVSIDMVFSELSRCPRVFNPIRQLVLPFLAIRSQFHIQRR